MMVRYTKILLVMTYLFFIALPFWAYFPGNAYADMDADMAGGGAITLELWTNHFIFGI